MSKVDILPALKCEDSLMSLRQHKKLGNHSMMDSQGSRFTGLPTEFASTRSHRPPGGSQTLLGVPLFSSADFTLEPHSNNRRSEFSNSVLDGFRISKNRSEVKKNHGLAAIGFLYEQR